MTEDYKRLDHGVIDLSQFREKKKQEEELMEPIFTEPTIITLGDPVDEEKQIKYLLLVNLVINNKQFLALESLQEDERGEVAIVEAVVEDGEFAGVQVVATEEEFNEVTAIMTEALNSSSVKEEEVDESND